MAKHLTVKPTLAGKFDAAKAEFPCHVQPKINGVRCLSGDETALTRNGNPFIDAVQALLSVIDMASMPAGAVLDGELYIHGQSLQEIASAVKRAQPLTQELRYCVFDAVLPADLPFAERWDLLQSLKGRNASGPLQLVETSPCPDLEALEQHRETFIAAGFEGLIYRRSGALYCQGRSSSELLKWPTFENAEFVIIGAHEGNGKATGTPVFTCETAGGERFSVSMEGAIERRRQMWLDRESLMDKPLTVRFKELTDRDVPFDGVGVAVRDYEGRPAPGAASDAEKPNFGDEVR